jgi:hypothetical protein
VVTPIEHREVTAAQEALGRCIIVYPLRVRLLTLRKLLVLLIVHPRSRPLFLLPRVLRVIAARTALN